MTEYMFGCGIGYLPKRADRIARKHGAILVNHCDPGCRCGYGCIDECPECRRHWFSAQNRGEPFDGATARAVMAEINAAKIKAKK
jgi:hypothetical protein